MVSPQTILRCVGRAGALLCARGVVRRFAPSAEHAGDSAGFSELQPRRQIHRLESQGAITVAGMVNRKGEPGRTRRLCAPLIRGSRDDSGWGGSRPLARRWNGCRLRADDEEVRVGPIGTIESIDSPVPVTDQDQALQPVKLTSTVSAGMPGCSTRLFHRICRRHRPGRRRAR